MWVVWVLGLVFAVVQGQLRLDPLVSTPLGLIRGLRASDGDYSMFLGIPYAKVNADNPFGSSTPHPSFEDVFEAYDDSTVCPQAESSSTFTSGKIDCLNLNVYVPNSANKDNRMPVIVWIHGGSLATGSGNRYIHGPKYLVQHDVILVTINYRLGPYGFMCLDIPEVPGNQGAKDQSLAMRWVKNNIPSFGGDVNKITIMGESAGASSVEYHLYSNEDLMYNKAILQSGSVFTAWAIKEANASAPLKIAERLGFQTENITESLNFLKDVNPKLVIGASTELGFVFRVCVEKEFEGVDSFLTKHPLNSDIPKARNIPIMTGFNSHELLGTFSNKPTGYFNNLNIFEESLKVGFNYDDEFLAMEDILRHFYIGDEEIGSDVKDAMTEFRSDIDENYPIQKSMKKFLKNEARDVFHYVFSYDGGRNYNKNKSNITEEGAAHADDIGYLFDTYDKTTPTDKDQKTIDRMTTLWTNFAKYGNPTPELTDLLPVQWIPITHGTYNYLEIGEELTMKKRPYHARMTFWELFYKANEEKLKGYRRN